MPNGRQVTNQDIYDRMERLRLEITTRIDKTSQDHRTELADLRRQFETLEAGRLTRAEGKITDMELVLQRLNDTLSNTDNKFNAKFVTLGAIGMVILASFLSALFLWLFGQGGK